jgi:hypothetical protein
VNGGGSDLQGRALMEILTGMEKGILLPCPLGGSAYVMDTNIDNI